MNASEIKDLHNEGFLENCFKILHEPLGDVNWPVNQSQ